MAAAHSFVSFVPERLFHRTGQVGHFAHRPLRPIESEQCNVLGFDRQHLAGGAVFDAGQQRSDCELATRRDERLYGYIDVELCREPGCEVERKTA